MYQPLLMSCRFSFLARSDHLSVPPFVVLLLTLLDWHRQIVSLASYRRWLKDQAAYRRKAMHGVPSEVD